MGDNKRQLVWVDPIPTETHMSADNKVLLVMANPSDKEIIQIPMVHISDTASFFVTEKKYAEKYYSNLSWSDVPDMAMDAYNINFRYNIQLAMTGNE